MSTRVKNRRMGSRLFSAILAMLMVVTIMTANGIVTGAANTTDTEWSFNISTSNSSYSLSDVRPKYDASSFYVYWMSKTGPTSFYLQTYGSLTNSKSSMVAYNYNGVKLIPGTGRYSVRNLVYETFKKEHEENGKTIYACFGAKASTISGYIGGLWSPDSSGSYTLLSVPALEY